MTARGFDVYDQMVTVATTPQPTPTPATTPTAQAAAMPKVRGADVMLRFCAYLLTFAGALWLAALFDTVHPLVTAITDVTVPFVAVVLAGLLACVTAAVRR